MQGPWMPASAYAVSNRSERMKRQGIEGFTFDSKAEEWADRPRNRVLWPLAAGGAVCVIWALLMLAKQAGWL